jgi:hypothetical protein
MLAAYTVSVANIPGVSGRVLEKNLLDPFQEYQIV